ncbi:MAG: DUF1631 domain-containing protein [Burkholderiaceae bacterium]
MVSNSIFMPHDLPVTPSKQRAVMQRLVAAASGAINPQLDAFAAQIATRMLTDSSQAADAREANLCFNAGNLLRHNAYPFYHLASAQLRTTLQDAVDGLDSLVRDTTEINANELTLVPFSEMENRLLLDRASRPLELANLDLLASLNLRLAKLLGREELQTIENPFRPAVLISAFDQVWREFDPDPESHHLLLRQIESGLFINLTAVLQIVNQTCTDAGILPNLPDTPRVRKSPGNRNASRGPSPALVQQLRQLLNVSQEPSAYAHTHPGGQSHGIAGGSMAALPGASPLHVPEQSADTLPTIAPALSSYLAELQRRSQPAKQGDGGPRSAYRLGTMKAQLPRDAMSRADETTVDVMTRIFDAVFSDPNIPKEMKELIGYLQVPVLKAALVDKEFFFQEMHPARRLISLLTRSSIGWDQAKGYDDPLYRVIAHNVDRAQGFDSEMALFDEVVDDLEKYFGEEERQAAIQLAAPITHALKQEKIREATRCATTDVAVRLETGEVVTFVEAFLESRWVPVLTFAHSVKDEKPQVLQNAIKTMDDLIWSVQPKITAGQRKELVAKLPLLLSTLNKWLNIVKWDNADRLQFFADLAECHASIVRAPLELSPHRQMELAVQAAQKATERRMEKRAAQAPEAEPNPFLLQVESLERGMWFEFLQADRSLRRVKLAWVSPLKSLYIFTTVHREEAFSMAADQLAECFCEERVRVIEADGFVARALVEALADQTIGIAASETV